MSLRPMVDALVGGFHDASKPTECDELAAWCDEMARHYATSEKMGDRYCRIANLLRSLQRERNDAVRIACRLNSALHVLKEACDTMMAPLGYSGSISARDDRAQAVMGALAIADKALDEARATIRKTEQC